MQKKAFSAAVFLLAAICSLTACNKNGSILIKNQVKECTLTFWNWDNGHEDFYEKIVSDYEEENKGVTINIRLVPYETYTQEWLKAASEGDTADVFAIPPESLNEFINSRKLEALTYADLIPAGSEGEKTYALPAAGSIPVIFYNKEIYEQNQLVVPETLSDFVTNCAVLKQSSCQPFAMSLTEDGVFDSFDFAAGILANGKSLKGKESEKQDFKKLLGKNTGYYDLLGIAMELSLDKELCVKGHQALLENFAQKKYAMICGTTEDTAWLNNSMSSSYGWFLLPGEDYTNAGVWKANHMFGAAKKGKSVKEAKKFLSYLLTQKNQLAFSSEFGMLPAVRGLKPDDKEIRQAYELVSGKKEVYYPFYHAMSQDEKTICAEKLDMIFSGKVTDPEGFLSDWIRELKN